MAARRLVVIAVAGITTAVFSPPASAESLATCAQRVIRDWYSGGRVDSVYPLGCYRAAIRALPDDVLQYSDADQDIARAMALARRGLRDAGNKAPVKADEGPAERSDEPASQAARAVRRERESVRLASGQTEPSARGAALPYPVILLGALACILLGAGAVSWLTARRR